MMRRLSIGYRYWYVQRTPYGWRQIGPEMSCVMDDFRTLVPTAGAR